MVLTEENLTILQSQHLLVPWATSGANTVWPPIIIWHTKVYTVLAQKTKTDVKFKITII